MSLISLGCSDGNDPDINLRESIRDQRYCEIALFFLQPGGISSETYNTFGFNDCPQDEWDAIDFDANRQALGANVIRPNGPRRWLMDTAELAGSEEADRRFFGNLEFRVVANIQIDGQPPTPGIQFLEAKVKRDSRLVFFKDTPVFELLAPLGKRYVMQSYALYIDPDLTIDDLQALEPRISLPEGWLYQARQLDADLEVEDFQGLATALRDPLANTYQRAETLEYLSEARRQIDIFNSGSQQYWSAIIDAEEASELQPGAEWTLVDRDSHADKSVYSRSPDATLDGRFSQSVIGDQTFNYSAQEVCVPELHASGLVITSQRQAYRELTYLAGKTVKYIRNSVDEVFVLVSTAPGASSEPAMLPEGWSQGEVTLDADWRIVLEGRAHTVDTVDGAHHYQGPVHLPGMPIDENQGTGSSFTLKLLRNTGESPFSNLVYECDQCTFEQHAAIQPPPGWSKGPQQVILPPGELLSAPCFEGVPSSVDFIPEIPGNEFRLIGKNLSGSLLEIGPNGLMVLSEVMRDTVFRFPAGTRVHELTNPAGEVYVLFGYEVDSKDFTEPDFQDAGALSEYPRPTGWTYNTYVLERERVMDPGGVASVLSIRAPVATSTWEKR